MIEYVWLIPLLPLIGFVINGILGRRLGKTLVSLIGCGTIGVSFLISVKILFELLSLPAEHRIIERVVFPWIYSGLFKVNVSFLLDPLSCVMILVVSGVGFFIHVYSIGYMGEDKGFARFFSFMNLFVFFMLTLVLSNNFLLLYLGWEGVGLCSYLLIGFWYEKKSASDAAKKAFIVNRIGDFGFALGIMLIFWTFGTLNYSDVFLQAPSILTLGGGLATAITLLLFAGAVGKSAQIPLYVWLPDAMEGPTPVSALIHAATMVTAGVYMVARCHVLFQLAPFTMGLVAVIGAVTALYTASIGMVQNDIKRVLAYSTISQLGYMFLGCGVGAFASGIFHLMTHAFFKALLFLGAGCVMHALSGELNMQKMGELKNKLPVTFWTMFAAVLAISGIPLFSGFFSKDEILWKAFSQGNLILWIIGLVTAGMTAFYMFRLFFLTFFGKSRVDESIKSHIHESPKIMIVPLMVLAVLSVIGGYIGVPKSLGGGNNFESFLSPVFGEKGEIALHPASTEYLLMALSVVVALLGIFFAYRFYIKSPDLPKSLAQRFSFPYKLLLNKYYVDELYFKIVVNPLLKFATFLWQFFDVKVIDGIANGLANTVNWFAGIGRKVQTGYVRNYALGMVFGVLLILAYFILR
ncbi:MAG: NADH-quinone oxidoreductase subunit L [candidate division Zixibacteria bacterium]|nr:NADH-quinone oxidoreductase subunit L [candidate division Zixibacteria bacterium]